MSCQRLSFIQGRENITLYYCTQCTEAEFVDEIQIKVWKVFLLAIHSHLYSFALRFLFLQTLATSYSLYSSVTVHCKGERKKTWQKTIPPSLWFKKSIPKPQVWDSQDYAQKPQLNCTFMNSSSVSELQLKKIFFGLRRCTEAEFMSVQFLDIILQCFQFKPWFVL